jgi:hypothetical protein
LAGTYALLGVCLGPIFGPVGGVFIAFLVPSLDIGIGQSPMLHPEPATWARMLPGWAPTGCCWTAASPAHLDQTGSLLLGLAWSLALAVRGVAVPPRRVHPGPNRTPVLTARAGARVGSSRA